MTRRVRRLTALLLAGTLAASLTGCVGGAAAGSDETISPENESVYPEVETYPDIRVTEDVTYGIADGVPLTLDVCTPAPQDDPRLEQAERPAIVSIHGGSWRGGDKASVTWRSICQWFADAGYVTVSVNYRLAPEHTFPAQLEDVQAVVEWLRAPARVQRYGIDTTRIGAFGGSAGGNLAALLGTTGSGPWDSGARVAAVADLSGPADLRSPIVTLDSATRDFPQAQREFLGCDSLAQCPEARLASPTALVDETDPPHLVAHSTRDFIPIRQAAEFVDELRAHDVDTTYITVEGSQHSAAMLDDELRARLLDFFGRTLAAPAAPLPTATPAP